MFIRPVFLLILLTVSATWAQSVRPQSAPSGTAPKLVVGIVLDWSYYSVRWTGLLEPLRILQPGRRQLDSVLAHWRANSPAQIDVVGHADQIGDRALNRTLSEFRTRVVVNYLRNQEIDSTQLCGLWHGDTQLLITDNNPALRCQNRRVVIIPYSK